MKSRQVALAASLILLSISASAATIYECRAYNGTNFLTNNYCSQSKGIGVRNWTVPDNMTFDEQVQNVEAAKSQERARQQTEVANKHQVQVNGNSASQNKAFRCKSLEEAISMKDSELRKPHSGQWGDYLTEERKKLMDQRFDLRC